MGDGATLHLIANLSTANIVQPAEATGGRSGVESRDKSSRPGRCSGASKASHGAGHPIATYRLQLTKDFDFDRPPRSCRI